MLRIVINLSKPQKTPSPKKVKVFLSFDHQVIGDKAPVGVGVALRPEGHQPDRSD